MQEVQDGEVFAGLGLNAFVGGNYEQNRVYPSDASQHVADKVPMPRDVYQTHFFTVWKRQRGETQFNRHLPLMLLFKPVRVNAR